MKIWEGNYEILRSQDFSFLLSFKVSQSRQFDTLNLKTLEISRQFCKGIIELVTPFFLYCLQDFFNIKILLSTSRLFSYLMEVCFFFLLFCFVFFPSHPHPPQCLGKTNTTCQRCYHLACIGALVPREIPSTSAWPAHAQHQNQKKQFFYLL